LCLRCSTYLPTPALLDATSGLLATFFICLLDGITASFGRSVTPVLVFDIETIPDIAGLRRLRVDWRDLEDSEVADRALSERRERTGGDFLPLHLHRVIAISCVLRNDAGFRVGSIGAANDAEASLIQSFFGMIDRHTPQLVSWNGSSFDLPVLHYRGLLAGVSAARYWELGDSDQDFRYNNYIARYHTRHTDLMDLLAMYQPRATAPLDDMAKLAGYAGKLGMDGSQVWQAYCDGKIDQIRSYCETDVVNTYLLFNRFQKMRGALNDLQMAAEEARVRESLQHLPASHWREYLNAWPAAAVALI
jgi:3'-5' exonuclease